MVASRLIRGPEVAEKLAQRRVLSVPESLGVLVDGFQNFQRRTYPSRLGGISFVRIAGQAACLDESLPRSEIKRILDNLQPGGAFLVFGHGGVAKCGAIAAKQAALALPKGEHLHEPNSVLSIVNHIPDDVGGLGSPDAELLNAKYQAEKIYEDPEFRGIINRKNLTIVYAVWTGTDKLEFQAINRTAKNGDLLAYHPQLLALSKQMNDGARKLIRNGGDKHYAHAAVAYEPSDLRTILDPFNPTLVVGGICCVDARLTPNTPDGPKYLWRSGPNRIFGVTYIIGASKLCADDSCSLAYAFRHVSGINSLAHEGEEGNGHLVVLATRLDFALTLKNDLMHQPVVLEATNGGANISLASFDGKTLSMVNLVHGIEESFLYTPKVNILTL